jgi:hypothetical protein
MQLSLRSYAPGDGFAAQLDAFLAAQRRALDDAHALSRPRIHFHLLAGAWLAAHTGDVAKATEILDLVGEAAAAGGHVAAADMSTLVRAEIDLAQGRAKDAVARLQPRAGAGNELYFLHSVLMRAHVAAGNPEAALDEALWLGEQRGRAFAEPNSDYSWQLANITESNLSMAAAASLAEQLGRRDVAESQRKRFAQAWPSGAELPPVQRRLEALD